MSHPRTAIVWFRRDLRVHDHPALSTAVREFERVIPTFVFDPTVLRGRYRSGARTRFMRGCLRDLDDQLRRRGSALIARDGRPEQALVRLAAEAKASAVFWTSDVSPYARARDRRVTAALQERGIEARPHSGSYIVDVSKLRTRDGRPYHVFSPFHRSWQDSPRRERASTPRTLPPIPEALRGRGVPNRIGELGLAELDPLSEPIVQPGEAAARRALARWLSDGLERYAQRQNGIARRGTSQLSPYLRWGCLSPLELEARAAEQAQKAARTLGESGRRGPAAWTRQLAWRDFYAHVLLHWPDNLHGSLQPRLRELEWDSDSDRLDAWREGRTGYPLVDAGMRQLAQTGWMHNRARLTVGSFLTKDLHLDWREGELHFARLLLDGEPAQNNGNWQWIASVGTDPAPPYRRMYNPTLQARRFDPDGEYIRRWVPELAHVPTERIFEPWRLSESEQRRAGCVIGRDYPAPVVDHRHERERALQRYGMARAGRAAASREGRATASR